MTFKNNELTTRRDFLKGTFAITLGLGFTKNLHNGFHVDLVSSTTTNENEEGVPKRRLVILREAQV